MASGSRGCKFYMVFKNGVAVGQSPSFGGEGGRVPYPDDRWDALESRGV